MRALIRSLAVDSGKTVFLSSHLLHEVQQVCDRVAIIDKGEVIHESTIADLLHRDLGLRVEASPAEAAEAALAGRWPTRIEAGRIHVAASRDEAPEVARRLVEAGIELFAMAPDQHSLEDVFLSLTQGEGADA
jgi:ABC-2 type transport system ATP-binding protein